MSGGPVTGSKNYTISDAHVTQFIVWAREAYPAPVLPDDRTDAQVLAAWADSIINGTKMAVTKRMKDAAAATAAGSEGGISIT